MRSVARGGLLMAVAVLGAVPSDGGGPYQYHALTPCRLADTRNPNGPSGGPILADNGTRMFPVQGICGVPVGANAVSLNVTAVNPNGQGYLKLFPSGITAPLVSTVNFSAGEPAIANGAIVPLADQATNPLDLSVFSRVAVASGTVHVVLDVTGYFQ